MRRINVLGRKYSDDVMMAADAPKSAGEISDEIGIPIATCYRRVNELATAGLLTECTDKNADGKTVTRFRRTTDAIDIRFDTTISIRAWPRDTRPFTLARFVPTSLTELSIGQLPWSSREGPVEATNTEISTPPQSEYNRGTNR